MPTTMVQRKSFMWNVYSKHESRKHTLTHTHALTRLPAHKNICAGVSLPTILSTTLQAETAVFCLYLLDNIRNGSCGVCVLYITACVLLSQYVHCICFERTNNPFSLTIFTREAFVSLYHNLFTTCFFGLLVRIFQNFIRFLPEICAIFKFYAIHWLSINWKRR